jgi:hypothetical protein
MTAKRHHAVPQFYLRRFSNSDGYLWLHDRHQRIATQVHTRDAMVEKYLYAPQTGDEPYDDALEKHLAVNVEGPAALPLEKLSKGDELSEVERQHLSLFLAYQEVRVPRMRDLITAFTADVGQRVLEIAASNPKSIRSSLESAGESISDATLTRMTELVLSGGIKVEATKMAWLETTLANAGEMAGMLYRMPWFVVEAHSQIEFLTSDAPIVKVLTDRTVPREFAGGWLSPSAEATFALDPKHCLVIRPDGKQGRGRASKLWCKDVNSRLVRQAHRFVASRSRDTYVEAIGDR